MDAENSDQQPVVVVAPNDDEASTETVEQDHSIGETKSAEESVSIGADSPVIATDTDGECLPTSVENDLPPLLTSYEQAQFAYDTVNQEDPTNPASCEPLVAECDEMDGQSEHPFDLLDAALDERRLEIDTASPENEGSSDGAKVENSEAQGANNGSSDTIESVRTELMDEQHEPQSTTPTPIPTTAAAATTTTTATPLDVSQKSDSASAIPILSKPASLHEEIILDAEPNDAFTPIKDASSDKHQVEPLADISAACAVLSSPPPYSTAIKAVDSIMGHGSYRPLLPKPPPSQQHQQHQQQQEGSELDYGVRGDKVVRAQTVNVPKTTFQAAATTTASMTFMMAKSRKRNLHKPQTTAVYSEHASRLASTVGAGQPLPSSQAPYRQSPMGQLMAGGKQLSSTPNKPSPAFPPANDNEIEILTPARGARETDPVPPWNPAMELLSSRPSSPPPYRFTPPPEELGLNIPAGGYPCVDCGDVYALKSSLEFHLERRVLHIQVYCTLCRNTYVFTNRCRYLEHQRRHNSDMRPGTNARNKKSVYRDVQMLSVQGSAMDQGFDEWFSCPAFQRLADLYELYEYELLTSPSLSKKFVEDDGDAEPAIELLASRTSRSAGAKEGLVVPPLRKQPLAPFSLPNVSASGLGSGGAASVTANAAGSGGGGGGGGCCRCSECAIILPNGEELKRHFVYNLPANQKQFICQTCSAVYFSLCSFAAHKRTHEGSESKQAPYTCAECGIQQVSSRSLANHLLDHRLAPTVLNAWRCQKCFTFYSNWNTLVVHTATAHCEYYYKCPQCPTAFQGFKNFDDHRRSHHAGAQAAIQAEPAPKCPQCDCLYQTKDQLVEHLKSHLGTLTPFKVFRCPVCGRLMENKNGLVAHFGRSHGIEIRSDDVREIPFDIGQSEPSAAPATSAAAAQPAKSNALRTDGTIGAKKRPQATTDKLIAAGASGMEVRCPRCPDDAPLLPNEFMLKLHLTVKHGESLASINRDPYFAKRPKKDGVEKRSANEASTIVCKQHPCFFVAASKEEMRRHALSHKKDKNFLCLECSLSFVSDMSLKRHLIDQHQITDPDAYMRDFSECVPSQVTNELLCMVCGEEFGSKAALDVHARQHGLMFLKRNQISQQQKDL